MASARRPSGGTWKARGEAEKKARNIEMTYDKYVSGERYTKYLMKCIKHKHRKRMSSIIIYRRRWNYELAIKALRGAKYMKGEVMI